MPGFKIPRLKMIPNPGDKNSESEKSRILRFLRLSYTDPDLRNFRDFALGILC